MAKKVWLSDGETIQLEIKKREEEQLTVALSDGEIELSYRQLSPNLLALQFAGKTYKIPFVRQGNKITLAIDGYTYSITPHSARKKRTNSLEAGGKLTPPMPGVVVKIPVREGEKVKKDQILVIINAMKMEIPIRAPRSGIVQKIPISEGERVDPSRELIQLSPIEENEN